MPVLSTACGYGVFVIAGCVLHTRGVSLGKLSGIGHKDNARAKAFVLPCIFSGRNYFSCIAAFSSSAHALVGMPFPGNTSAFSLNGDYVVLLYHSEDK